MDLEQLQSMAGEAVSSGSIFDGFSGWALFWGFAFGTIGFWILKNAKKKGNPGLFGIGLVLLIYPYFITNPWWCFLVGASLCLFAKKIWE